MIIEVQGKNLHLQSENQAEQAQLRELFDETAVRDTNDDSQAVTVDLVLEK